MLLHSVCAAASDCYLLRLLFRSLYTEQKIDRRRRVKDSAEELASSGFYGERKHPTSCLDSSHLGAFYSVFSQSPFLDLGSPPWSDEVIESAVLLNRVALQSALDKHPGRDMQERLESLASVLRLFNKAADTILESINLFHSETHKNNLFRRNRRYDRQQFEERIQEALYVFAACSLTLVDQSRALTSKVSVPGYRERVARDFSENPRHRFVQELRVDMIHVTLHEPGWQLISDNEGERTTRFLLHASQLRRIDAYHPLAKRYVDSHPNGIDLGFTVSQYKNEVNKLHAWLRGAVESVAFDILADYRRSQRIVRAVSARSWWRVILSQVLIQANRDPYDYLDQYLTPDEIREVMSLPHRSKEQVDRIVEIIDEDGACDIELRKLVYRAFNVTRS